MKHDKKGDQSFRVESNQQGENNEFLAALDSGKNEKSE